MKVSDLCREYGLNKTKFEKYAEEQCILSKLRNPSIDAVIADSVVPSLVSRFREEMGAEGEETVESTAEVQMSVESSAAVQTPGGSVPKMADAHTPAPSSVPATEATMSELLGVTKKIHFWIKFWSVLMIISFILFLLLYVGSIIF